MGMSRRVLKLTLSLTLLLLALSGCDGGRAFYHAIAQHRIVMVPTEAMVPTIKPGDRAAVDERYYANHPVQRFDMVTFKLTSENLNPEMMGTDESTVYLKRIIGLGGETVEIRGGRIFIDGQALEEPFATVPLSESDRFGPVKIPEGEFFLMGDNRPNSLDGRYWARPTLRRQYILGKVVEIFPR
jgi:signal peptidase I